MLVPLTQLGRVRKVYFPLALPGPKGINVEFTGKTWQAVDWSIRELENSSIRRLENEKTRKLVKEVGHSPVGEAFPARLTRASRLAMAGGSRDLEVSTNFLILQLTT